VSKFTDWVYDRLDSIFPKVLDKAFDQGLRIGAEYAARKMSMTITEFGDKANLTKAQAVGYEVALQAVQEAKQTINKKTGAML
jgi:hypothetical protein